MAWPPAPDRPDDVQAATGPTSGEHSHSQPSAGAAPAASARPHRRLLGVLGYAVAGAIVGLAWRGAEPLLSSAAGDEEVAFSRDAALAVVGAVAGLLNAAVLLRVPRRAWVTSFALALPASAAASLLAVLAGRSVGAGPVGAWGLAFAWPLVLCLAVLTGAVVAVFRAD